MDGPRSVALKLSVARATVNAMQEASSGTPIQGLGGPAMRVTFATLPKSVTVVVIDAETLVVTERLRAAIEPRLPYAAAAVLVALGIADAARLVSS